MENDIFKLKHHKTIKVKIGKITKLVTRKEIIQANNSMDKDIQIKKWYSSRDIKNGCKNIEVNK